MTTSRSVSATEFKARCLELMDVVRDSGTLITITKRGKPVARLVPIEADHRKLHGALPVTIAGDIIIGPIGEAWDAER